MNREEHLGRRISKFLGNPHGIYVEEGLWPVARGNFNDNWSLYAVDYNDNDGSRWVGSEKNFEEKFGHEYVQKIPVIEASR